ncbi:porin family protein [Arcicella sp. LKC2W]|uniref:porin family protein n=1 Tax=Arcicella sp. LKC2W TaxID=2984198 RepID=UPI002B1EFC14|nr:porin family protein [Arcicella sp. LKC2W]MEA5459800.1 porin family protein [Arcicella sp. LKC2W]
MNKKLLAFLFVLAFAKVNVSFSQFSLGIRGGVNFSQLKTDFKTQSFGDNLQQSLDTKTGYVGGIYARIGNKFFVQPELIFSAKGGKINILPTSGSTSQTVAIDYSSIDVPLLIGFKLGPLRLNAGPMASFIVSSDGLDEALKKYSSNLGESFKNAAYGYQAGGGLDIGALSVDLRYEGSLSEIAGLNSSNINFSQKGNLWQLTLGLKML